MTRTVAVALLLLAISFSAAAQPPSPEEFLGHPVGADRKLAPYPRVLEYLRLVAQNSDRVSVESAGTSTLGNEMVTVVLTSAANQADLERYRGIAAELARPDRLTPERAARLAAEGRAIVLVTCTIHATEVGCTQMATEFAYQFATTTDPDRLAWMENVILLLMPSINPDGQVLVIDWYEKQLGTEFEGGRMPWLYQHYVGHDNNRDFYMLTQAETRNVNDLLYHRWFPQVFIDEHQMGSTGPRMFVPPQTDPLALEVDSLIFRQADLIGTNMSYRLEEAGKTGVGHNMIFDSYWPGGTRNTAWWKNVTGLLTEVASVRIATPIHIDPGELAGGRKGLPEYKRRANFPSPWPGGWWRLRDIVEYELIATWAALETCSDYREELLANFYRMGARQVAAGRAEAPFGWVVPPDQHDPGAAGRLVELLLRHGVTVQRADEPFTVGRTTYPAGSWVVPAAQPYRAFLLTMLRRQRYPEIRPYEGGPIFPPYDVTAWSLPLLMGVAIDELDRPFQAAGLAAVETMAWPSVTVAPSDNGYLLSHSHDSVYAAMNRLLAAGKRIYWLTEEHGDAKVGDVWIPAEEVTAAELQALADELHLPVEAADAVPVSGRLQVRPVTVGLFKPWVASMDEGWTRFLLEGYEFPFRNLANEDVRDGSFDGLATILFPDVGKSIIEKGEPSGRGARFWSPLPPEYAGGVGSEGGERLKEWVRNGGTVVALDSSAEYLIDLFELPVSDVLGDGDDDFSAPGTLVRLLVDTGHPLGYGLRQEEAGYFASSPAFRTRLPDARFDRRVVARYPDHRDDILVSGYLKGAQKLERRAAVVEFQVGDGHVILIGFRAQHRAQPLRTFKLLFNALYYGSLVEAAR
ncbi:MAG: M14 family metallopeptidase [Thermoanaerobaculia bacterium]|nr:M14 family metallopeptidase [Thermoanaerobaculia bacterium]